MKRKHRRILQTVIAAILLVIGVMLWLGAVGYVRGVRDLRLPRASLLATTMPEDRAKPVGGGLRRYVTGTRLSRLLHPRRRAPSERPPGIDGGELPQLDRTSLLRRHPAVPSPAHPVHGQSDGEVAPGAGNRGIEGLDPHQRD